MTEELRKLAQKAAELEIYENAGWYNVGELLDPSRTGVHYPKNARFIAAASPDVVLGLLDSLDAAQADVERLLKDNAQHVGTLARVDAERDQLRSRLAEIEKLQAQESRCANCGTPASKAAECITADTEDGEWFCCSRCQDQHVEFGCPHETHDGYRHPVESERLMECEDVLRSLASWLGVGGYNAPTVDPKIFEEKIREGVEMAIKKPSPTPLDDPDLAPDRLPDPSSSWPWRTTK